MYSQTHINALNEDIKKHFSNIVPIEKSFKLHFEGVSRMVMLDRYAQKDDLLKTLKVGDLVVTIIKDDPNFPTRGIGLVKEFLPDNKCVIEIEDQYVGSIDPALQVSGQSNQVIKLKDDLHKPLELFFEQIAHRVGQALAAEEKPAVAADFIRELAELNFIPAGRVLYGAGSKKKVTFFNCFVMPFIGDSRTGIARHREYVAEIMSRGGGVGTNGSTLRPKGAIAVGVGGTSSGAVSWLNDLSQLTHLIEQGGSRRGAQMIMMADWHPNVVEFIISKMQNIGALLYIREHFASEAIINEVTKKLVFKPFNDDERTMYEKILAQKTAFADSEFIKKIEHKLHLGGKYEVVNPKFLTGANISVTISDKFMEAVEADAWWDFKFPDNAVMTADQKRFYEEKWNDTGDVFEWERLGQPVRTFGKIKARELWRLINFCATYSAEPGIFFLDRANKMTNAAGYGQRVVCTNPCGEQPLTPYAVCNLGAINLGNFVDKRTQTVDFAKLQTTVRTCVRLQDNIIDATPYFLEENKQQALGERRIGMGVMGLHDMLIWAGLRYGSPAANVLVDKVFETIATTAYQTSIELAKEKGSFPFLTDREKFIQSGYLQAMPDQIRQDIVKYGLRNSHLLTVAPTGSTGTMIGCSTGLEPYFAFSYYRSGRLGKFLEVQAPIVEEWLTYHQEFVGQPLPDIFVSAMELSPYEHADVQCIIQRWVDSSISKTVNAPRGYTVEQVEEIYMYLYKHGAKGGTVYVDGSRDSQVLSLDNKDNELDDTPVATAKLKVDESNKLGNEVGDMCPICQVGTLIEAGGCVTCNNCNAQVKCGL